VRVDFVRSLFLTLIRHSRQTGLCVYEVDDPVICDDPNVDKVSRLRDRIAELESLVREMQGNRTILPSPSSPLTPSSIKENHTLAGVIMMSAGLRLRTTATSLRNGILECSRNRLALARNSSPSRQNRSIHPTISSHIVCLGPTPTLHMMVTIHRPHLSRTLPPPARLPCHIGTIPIRPITLSGQTVPPRRLDSPAAVYRTPLSLLSSPPSLKRCIAFTGSSIVLLSMTPTVAS
jgi:hypothetical protein